MSSSEPVHVLLMGMTGAGKSSLINNFVNLAANKNFNNERLFAIPASFKTASGRVERIECNLQNFKALRTGKQLQVGESDTKFVNCYSLEFNGFKFSLIDTPGFNDTRGNQQDELNAKMVIEQVTAIAQIHAIIWVSKGNENRLGSELRYCVEMFRNLLPKGYENNFFAVFSHVGNALRIDAPEVLSQLGIDVSNSFVFENNILIPRKIFDEFYADDPDEHEFERKQMEKIWKRNQQNFNKLINLLVQIRPVDSKPIQLLHFKKHILEKILELYGKSEDSQADPNESSHGGLKQLKDKDNNIVELKQNKEVPMPCQKKTEDDRRNVKYYLRLVFCCRQAKSKKENPKQHSLLQHSETKDCELIQKHPSFQKSTNIVKSGSVTTYNQNKFKDSFFLLDQIIQREAQVINFERTNALEIINNRIIILKKTATESDENKQKEIEALENSKKRIENFNKLKAISNSPPGQHSIINFISLLEEVLGIDSEITSMGVNRGKQIAHKMQNEFKGRGFNEKILNEFNKRLDEFIEAVYLTKPQKV